MSKDNSKKTKAKSKGGRPTDYKESYNEQARKLSLLGLTDKGLADFFDVAVSTLSLWKVKHPSFSESIRAGGQIADANVTASLYERAVGYSHKEDHIAVFQGAAVITPTTKHYPPEPQAARYWLNNRQRKSNNWRDKQELELSGDGITLNLNYNGSD